MAGVGYPTRRLARRIASPISGDNYSGLAKDINGWIVFVLRYCRVIDNFEVLNERLELGQAHSRSVLIYSFARGFVGSPGTELEFAL